MAITEKMREQVDRYKKCCDRGDNIINIVHAYLQGLEDADVITEKQHDIIFSYITGLDS